ncbi:ribbon-helix-helix DNA binding domain protein [Microbacterium phage Pumpernickel]|uniref:Ribbon-helix-helix DNA binding domain protein n=1 Tax=Microbacterium phage Pumpernickel TaxID=2885983 RepID=A0AAE8Y771_9CAUD|nr:ribbon-helix-helix DNA binding domain protein [Microbacterium phage Pumpernickel]UDL15920.1 ribbon-helix-helix DNA binding domain protein [Microbacterium phage Pumpernickel]
MDINVVDSEGNIIDTWEVEDEIGELLEDMAAKTGMTPEEVLVSAVQLLIDRKVYEDEHREEL